MWALLMGLKTITPDKLHGLIQSHEPVIVIDVNAPISWMSAHVPGAINLDPVHLDESGLPDDKDAHLVFYCSNPMCRKAPNAARQAKGMGYRNVQVMSAGISGWMDAKLGTEGGR